MSFLNGVSNKGKGKSKSQDLKGGSFQGPGGQKAFLSLIKQEISHKGTGEFRWEEWKTGTGKKASAKRCW